jgi:outer membrane protein assembly factor BamB
MLTASVLTALISVNATPDLTTNAATPNSTVTDWPMFLYNPSRSSSPDDLAPVTYDLLWRFNTMPDGGDSWIISSSPAIVGDVVYVGNDDGIFYALNSSTGNCLWNQTLGTFTVSSPAVVEGVVYVSVWEGRDYALNATTGSVIWNSSRYLGSSSPAVVNGVHYICSGNGSLIAEMHQQAPQSGKQLSKGGECSPAVVTTVYLTDSGYACAVTHQLAI